MAGWRRKTNVLPKHKFCPEVALRLATGAIVSAPDRYSALCMHARRERANCSADWRQQSSQLRTVRPQKPPLEHVSVLAIPTPRLNFCLLLNMRSKIAKQGPGRGGLVGHTHIPVGLSLAQSYLVSAHKLSDFEPTLEGKAE